MEAIIFAHNYNKFTGASISHVDVEEMGFNESHEIEHALKFIRSL